MKFTVLETFESATDPFFVVLSSQLQERGVTTHVLPGGRGSSVILSVPSVDHGAAAQLLARLRKLPAGDIRETARGMSPVHIDSRDEALLVSKLGGPSAKKMLVLFALIVLPMLTCLGLSKLGSWLASL